MAKFLITGADGFTGRYMVAELQGHGHEVHGLVHKATLAPLPGCAACHAVDLTDLPAMKDVVQQVQPDVVVHLAAIAFVAHGDAEAIYRTNLVGSRNLLEGLAQVAHRPAKILLASSANVYGNATGGTLDESTPPSPANDYAVSKLAMEFMARLYADRLPIVVARPFNYTGVGQAGSFLLPKIVDHFRRKAPVLELGNMDVVRDFSDVRAVVARYRLLLDAGQAGEVFNVCSGTGHSLQQVLQMMRELSGHTPEVRVNPAFVRASEVHRLVGSRAKLDAVIGPVPDIALRDTLQWMLESAA